MVDEKQAEQLVESVFSFDYVGEAMMALRKNLDSEEHKQALITGLVESVLSKADDDSSESADTITKAATARVETYINGAKAAKGSGCGA